MRHLFLTTFAAGIALSACGGATDAPRSTTARGLFPGQVRPGAGEPTVIAAAEDETDALYVWATAGAHSLSVGTANRVCKPGGESCKDLPSTVCAPEVHTDVCELEQLDGEPRCQAVTLRLGEPVTVSVSAPYAALRLVQGTCLDAVRLDTPIQPRQQWWRQADRAHPRGWLVDMAEGGGTPQPGPDGAPATVWYTHPVGGPR